MTSTSSRPLPEAAPASGGMPASRHYAPAAAIGVAAFGAFLAFLDSTVVNVAFPNIQAAFPTVSVGSLSWVLNGYNVVFAGLLVLAGRFADLLGRRRLFKAGIVVFTVMSAACATSTSVGMLVAFRVLQAVGAAMLVPASLGVVVHAAPLERRNHALSAWAAAGALAAGLGPPIGGALVDLFNWRLVFLVNVPLGLLAWILTRRTVVESRAPGARVLPDLRGALLLSLGLGAVTFGVVQGGSWGWGSPGVVGAFVVAAAALLLTVRSSLRHRSPILDPELLRIRGFTVSNVVTVAAGLGLYTYLLAHILWLNYVWGYSLLLAGLAVAPGAIVAALVAVPCGRLADRYGPRAVVVPGALVWCGAYVWYVTRVGLHPDFLGQWLPGQILSGIGVGATVPVASAGGLSTVPAGRYATASAVNSSARQLGGVLGIAVLTTFIAHPTLATLPDDLRHGWILAAAAFAVAAVAALCFGRIRPSPDAGAAVAGEPLLEPAKAPVVEAAPDAGAADFFDLLPGDVRRQVLDAGEEVALQAGQVLFRAGDPGDALYALRQGRLEVRLPQGPARELRPGASLGELALLTHDVRSATVVARRDSRLVKVGREAFEGLAGTHPAVMAAVARGLAVRLRESRPLEPQGPPTPTVVAVVPAGPGAPVEAVASAVEAGLSGVLTVARLPGDASPDALGAAEAACDRVLLVGEHGAGSTP
ncbi:MAG: MDR family MFS transporter, partial [Acidimicrobiales bacterium]